MKASSTKFIFSSIIFSLIISAIAFTINVYKPTYINTYFYYLQYLFLAITVASFMLLNKNPSQDGLDYINKFFIAKGLKIIFSAIIIILYINIIEVNKISFIFNLFAIYLTYTAFEIKMLLANLRAQI